MSVNLKLNEDNIISKKPLVYLRNFKLSNNTGDNRTISSLYAFNELTDNMVLNTDNTNGINIDDYKFKLFSMYIENELIETPSKCDSSDINININLTKPNDLFYNIYDKLIDIDFNKICNRNIKFIPPNTSGFLPHTLYISTHQKNLEFLLKNITNDNDILCFQDISPDNIIKINGYLKPSHTSQFTQVFIKDDDDKYLTTYYNNQKFELIGYSTYTNKSSNNLISLSLILKMKIDNRLIIIENSFKTIKDINYDTKYLNLFNQDFINNIQTNNNINISIIDKKTNLISYKINWEFYKIFYIFTGKILNNSNIIKDKGHQHIILNNIDYKKPNNIILFNDNLQMKYNVSNQSFINEFNIYNDNYLHKKYNDFMNYIESITAKIPNDDLKYEIKFNINTLFKFIGYSTYLPLSAEFSLANDNFKYDKDNIQNYITITLPTLKKFKLSKKQYKHKQEFNALWQYLLNNVSNSSKGISYNDILDVYENNSKDNDPLAKFFSDYFQRSETCNNKKLLFTRKFYNCINEFADIAYNAGYKSNEKYDKTVFGTLFYNVYNMPIVSSKGRTSKK